MGILSITVPVKQILFVAVLHSETYRPSHSTQITFQTSLSTVCTTRKTSLFLTKIRWLWSREPICRESWILLFAYPAARWLCSLYGPHGGGEWGVVIIIRLPDSVILLIPVWDCKLIFTFILFFCHLHTALFLKLAG